MTWISLSLPPHLLIRWMAGSCSILLLQFPSQGQVWGWGPSFSSVLLLSSLCRAQDTSPLSPPLRRTKSRKHTRALQKLREVNKRLQDLRSCLSPKQHQDQDHLRQEDEVVLVEGPTFPQSSRLFQLKIRCRADLVRLPIRMSEPLQGVVDHMAAHLGVSPSRILLLFGETELSPTATPRTLKLGVADIIDCVVLASSPEAERMSQLLQLRVQGKEKHQMLEVSLSPTSPLKTLMSRYEEAMGLSGHKLSFFFDGMKLSGKEQPSDLGMESGDLIEVWGWNPISVWRSTLNLGERMAVSFGPIKPPLLLTLLSSL